MIAEAGASTRLRQIAGALNERIAPIKQLTRTDEKYLVAEGRKKGKQTQRPSEESSKIEVDGRSDSPRSVALPALFLDLFLS